MGGKEKSLTDTAWEVVETREVLKAGPWFNVSIQKVKLPDGKIVDDYYQIRCPDAVVTIAMTKDENVVMLRQYLHGVGRVSLVSPAGTVEKGEDNQETARRELLEETGYSSDQWTSLGDYVGHTKYGFGRLYYFLAVNAQKTAEPSSDDLEEAEIILLNRQEIVDGIRNKDIVSLGTISGLALSGTFISAGPIHDNAS